MSPEKSDFQDREPLRVGDAGSLGTWSQRASARGSVTPNPVIQTEDTFFNVFPIEDTFQMAHGPSLSPGALTAETLSHWLFSKCILRVTVSSKLGSTQILIKGTPRDTEIKFCFSLHIKHCSQILLSQYRWPLYTDATK